MQHRRRLQIFQAAKRAAFNHAHQEAKEHIATKSMLPLTVPNR